MANIKEICANGDIDALRLFIASGGDIRIEKDYALSTASEHGHIKVAQLLLANGCQATTNNSAPLRWAVYNGQIESARLLIKHGASPLQANKSLFVAVSTMNVEMVKLLIENGANPWHSQGKVYSFLHSISVKNKKLGLIDERLANMKYLLLSTTSLGEVVYKNFKAFGIPQWQFKDSPKFIFKAFIYAIDVEDFESVIKFLDILGNHPEIVDGKIEVFFSTVLSLFDRGNTTRFRNARATRDIILGMSRNV